MNKKAAREATKLVAGVLATLTIIIGICLLPVFVPRLMDFLDSNEWWFAPVSLLATFVIVAWLWKYIQVDLAETTRDDRENAGERLAERQRRERGSR